MEGSVLFCICASLAFCLCGNLSKAALSQKTKVSVMYVCRGHRLLCVPHGSSGPEMGALRRCSFFIGGIAIERFYFFYIASGYCNLAILRLAASEMQSIACIAILVLRGFATP